MSIDNNTCYLLVVKKYSKYIWVYTFLTKEPLIVTVKLFLNWYGNDGNMQRIQNNLGGKLAGSGLFCFMVSNSGYSLETTAPE